jgi:hypothetical protein
LKIRARPKSAKNEATSNNDANEESKPILIVPLSVSGLSTTRIFAGLISLKVSKHRRQRIRITITDSVPMDYPIRVEVVDAVEELEQEGLVDGGAEPAHGRQALLALHFQRLFLVLDQGLRVRQTR